jgi:glycosyltransferase involved in cell wall biosynthesis
MNQRQAALVAERTETVTRRAPASQPAGPRRVVCMIAYTNYVVDARVRREAETLTAAGFRVICLTTRNQGAEPTFVVNGVEVRELPVPKFRGKSRVRYTMFYLRFLLAASLACVRLLASKELDAVHVHNMPDFLVFAAVIPRLFGKPVVLDVHDTMPETFAAKFANGSAIWRLLCLEEKISALVAHRIICVHDQQRETMVRRGIPRAKTFISMNVPDPAVFGKPPRERSAAHRADAFNLVYHGTMVDRLGVDLVIAAVARLRARIPGLRLHLWGGGDDLPKFQALARSLALEDVVEFKPGGYPVDELPEKLAGMDVCVIGNRRSIATELMLPVKLMECVGLGIPAVAPRLRTIEHYFTPDMVSFYTPEDVDGLADAVWRLYSDPDLRLKQAARARDFLTEFGWERQAAELVSFYRQLCGQDRPSNNTRGHA